MTGTVTQGIARNAGNDWDAASSVGLTATEAAAARAVASRQPTPLICDPFAGPLVRAVGVDFFTQLTEQKGETGETGFAIPGMVDWIAARTRFYDDYFTAAQNAGIRQSVILGAGLDARSYRLAWPPGATVYEVDQPGVTHFKSATMAGLLAQPSADRRPVAGDLRGDWVPTLLRRGFDPSLPTVWSAEGLLPYLPPDGQDRLLDDISVLSAEGSWFAADFASDAGELAERIAGSMGGNERPVDAKVEISTTMAPQSQARSDAASLLRQHNWASMSFAARDLFAAYELPAPTTEENLYELVLFVTAFRAGGIDPLSPQRRNID